MPYGFERDKTKKKVNDYGKIGDGSVGSANQPVYIKDGKPIPSNKIPLTDGSLSSTSTNPVQNKVVTKALGDKANTSQLNSVNSSLQGQINDVKNSKVGTYNNNSFASVNLLINLKSKPDVGSDYIIAATSASDSSTINRMWSTTVWSDKRLKKNINKSKVKAMELLNSLDDKEFDFINEEYGQHTRLGFIAQEVENIIPEMVIDMPHDNESVKVIDYTKAIPFIIKALKEQVKINEKLQKEINELKSKQEGEK